MKKILITGATDGIGLETAKLLISGGHHLLLHGRNKQKLDKAAALIRKITPAALIDIYLADLSSFSDLNLLTNAILQEHSEIDVIINNAGILKTAQVTTKDRLDVRFVVNTFAPVVITQTLLQILSDDGRIVNLSSAAQAPIDIAALVGEKALNDDFQAYAQSKLALTVWSNYLAKSLKPQQVSVAVNPGSLLASKMVKEGFGVAGHDLSIGARILGDAVLSDEFADASGKYFDNDAKRFADPHPFMLNDKNCAQVMSAINLLIEKYSSC